MRKLYKSDKEIIVRVPISDDLIKTRFDRKRVKRFVKQEIIEALTEPVDAPEKETMMIVPIDPEEWPEEGSQPVKDGNDG